MAYKIPLAMLSVVPLCSGAPLNPRLQEFLTWFLDNQRTIDRSIESGSTVVEDSTTDTTTESNFMSSTVYTTLINIASTTTTEHTTTIATPATSAVSACEGMISLSLVKYIGLLLAFLIFLCVIGLVVCKTLRWCRNRKTKSLKQPDVEEGTIVQDPAELGVNRTRPCKFWYPEMQNKSKSDGFVTLSDTGEVVDVKHWSMQQLDAYFAEKSCLKDKGFLH